MALPIAVLAMAVHAPAWAAACVNDYDAWGWLRSWETQDDALTPLWCTTQAGIDGYWNALHLGDEDGTDWNGAAEGNSCNPDTHFSRVMNGAAMMDQVYYHLMSPTIGQNQYAYYWLANHVAPHSAKGYKADCGFDPTAAFNTIATHWSGSSTPTDLHYMFFWLLTANERAGTLIHECVHDWSGHIDAAQCSGMCGNSCDLSFGGSNAQTFESVYLDHSISTYRRAPGSDQLDVAHLGDLLGTGAPVCGYIPLLSPETREAAIGTLNWKLDSCFAVEGNPAPPTAEFTWASDPFWEYGNFEYSYDKMVGARWNCDEICNAAEWGSMCDAAAQPGNPAINSSNQALCNNVNGQLHTGVTPQQRASLQAQFNAQKKACVPGYSDTYLDSYCSTVSGSAADVAAIESSWNLADQPGAFDSGEVMTDCIQSYCQAHFLSQWAIDGRAACYEWDDSLGCLDAICGSLDALTADYGATSAEYFLAVQCRRHFIDNNGDASSYLDALQNQRHCDRVYTDCRNASAREDWLAAQALGGCSLVVDGVATTTGTYGLHGIASIQNYPSYGRFSVPFAQVQLDGCVAKRQSCEATEALLHKIVAEMLTITRVPYGIERLENLPDPPPYDYQNEVFHNVRQLATIAVAPPDPNSGFAPDQAIERLRHVPEANQALSIALGQQLYFAALGADSARASVFGAAKIHAFEDAEIPLDATESRAQATFREQLMAGKATREKLGSNAAMTLYDRAVATDMEAFFSFLKALQTATSIDEVDAAYDALDLAI
ncbi:MAG: hypothetical protein ABIJ09_13170 [Pseudomonadota bacterium]